MAASIAICAVFQLHILSYLIFLLLQMVEFCYQDFFSSAIFK